MVTRSAARAHPTGTGAAADGDSSPGDDRAAASEAPRTERSRRTPSTWRGGRWRRRVLKAWRRLLRSDVAVLSLLVALVLGLLAAHLRWRGTVPPSMFAVALLLGGFTLGVRALLALFASVAGALVVGAATARAREFPPGAALVVAAVGVTVLLFARSRDRLGVQGTRGEAMLVDLRDRLRAQGELPALPVGWNAEVVLRSAYGASFSGDFLVASRSLDGSVLELVLVDVSGKGVDAGTRALLLSGAFGGLLGAMPPEEFLPAANAYLIRHQWDDGFATAAHVAVDLDTGDYGLLLAGHPPPAQFHAGSGRWSLVEVPEGPLLGVLPGARYVRRSGRLERGDALLLYTDGLVETRERDVWVGIDRLLGEAERLVPTGFRHGTRTLVHRVGTGDTDDQALVLLWRS